MLFSRRFDIYENSSICFTILMMQEVGIRASLYFLVAALAAVFLSSCASQMPAKESRLVHCFEHGKTVYIAPNGKAIAPPRAPRCVKRMIAAANALTEKPYRYGGGHQCFDDHGYDCSGAVSCVLHAGGKIHKPMASQEFFDYGEKGYGDWVTLYVRNGHVFLVIAGARFDTGGTRRSTGPRWKPHPRVVKGYYVRHPVGL